MGVTNVGDVERTFDPLPVEVVTPVPPEVTARVALSPAAVPVVFWFSVGNVQFVKLPLEGVPRTGVTNVGDVLRTTFPDPVEVVTPVPPEATASVPVWSLRFNEDTRICDVAEAFVIHILPSATLTEISPATAAVGTEEAV